MSIDFSRSLGAVTRSVVDETRDGQPVRRVVLARDYATSADDLWTALTEPERLKRWFLPVTGDLRLGGRYQLEGNAGGTITECDRPQRLAMTWEFGGGMSWVEVDIGARSPDHSHLVLAHLCPVDDFWTRYGPGAAGVGWDLGLLGLDLFLAGEPRPDEAELAASPEGQALVVQSSTDWGRAAREAGGDADWADLATRRTTAFYTGQPEPEA